MVRLYLLARNTLSWLVLAVLAAVIGEFAIGLAREHGLYGSPTKRVEAVLSFLQNQLWFWPIVAALAGLVVGMWIDSFVRRRGSADAGTSETHDTTAADYAYGLVLVVIQPSLDDKNPGNTFELRLVMRNSVGLPLKFEVEKYEIIYGDIILKCAVNGAVIPKDGVLTLFPGRGLTRSQYAGLPPRSAGTLEYQIKYGHPDKDFSRRSYKLLQIDLFKKKGRADINWMIRNESEELVRS
jgi:hypothetical protein